MTIPQLEILPAIDVKDGRAVRLVQGELSATSTYGLPVEVASDFVSQGANWIHLVDLDAAFGTGSNFDLIKEVISSVDIKVELSGGIRDDASLERALATGCNRVNLGTAAIENPEWTAKVISQYGAKIAVGLDVRGHTLATRGPCWLTLCFLRHLGHPVAYSDAPMRLCDAFHDRRRGRRKRLSRPLIRGHVLCVACR